LSFETTILPIIVSIATSLGTMYFKSKWDARTHESKLNIEHSLSEKKKIKESISKYKVQMMNSCEILNHRLWNLAEHYEKKWHFVDGNYFKDSKYYFHSFIYRIASVVWWSNKIENELVYLDTTIADEEDLDFLKFCKFINITLSQVKLFKNLEYDGSSDLDHFYHHKLAQQVSCLSNANKSNIIDYHDYEEDLTKYLKSMDGLCKFIDGVEPSEDRLRWNRVYSLHLVLIAFLNNYGYDFQKTSEAQVKEIVSFMKLSNGYETVLKNLKDLLEKHMLQKNIEVKKIIDIISV
jgi:hypothetical protein